MRSTRSAPCKVMGSKRVIEKDDLETTRERHVDPHATLFGAVSTQPSLRLRCDSTTQLYSMTGPAIRISWIPVPGWLARLPQSAGEP